MNQKDRAINLGLKINSLKGNASVPGSVVAELENEIKNANINESDKIKLLELYKSVTDSLKKIVSPIDKEKGRFIQLVEDIASDLNRSEKYQQAEKLEGRIEGLVEEINKNRILKKSEKEFLYNRIVKLREKHKSRIGQFLKKNYEMLLKNIKSECSAENPFHVSISVKKFNEIVKVTPMFNDHRAEIQKYLDTLWQKSSNDIKIIKESEKKGNV